MSVGGVKFGPGVGAEVSGPGTGGGVGFGIGPGSLGLPTGILMVVG